MSNCTEADRAHLAAALSSGATATARALSARLRAEETAHAAARELPRRHLRLVPALSVEADQA
ncbi:MAG TPA: hypothetical protein VHU88_12580 [Sporichthyaceae bacterium]|jgi:hypothetical protein|nr:hypothetical protein [Sporichthyaceae bacterium]